MSGHLTGVRPGPDAHPEVKTQLAGLVQQLGEADIVAEAIARSGDPVHLILEAALEKRVELIVMSTHGRGGPGRWVQGSVAEKALQLPSLSVLFVPAD